MTIDIDVGLDLDSLLEESVDIQKKHRELKSAKKASNKGAVLPKTAAWMTGPEITQHYEEVKKIKVASSDWKPIAAILLIQAQVCSSCHTEHQRVEGIFVKKENLRLRAVSYAQPRDSLDLRDLPREIEIRPAYSPICPNCYTAQGWADVPISIRE